MLQTLNDLIEYFKQPDSELEHEEKQCLLRSLIKRQDLFKEEVRVDNSWRHGLGHTASCSAIAVSEGSDMEGCSEVQR